MNTTYDRARAAQNLRLARLLAECGCKRSARIVLVAARQDRLAQEYA
jgi:hypothetical protein